MNSWINLVLGAAMFLALTGPFKAYSAADNAVSGRVVTEAGKPVPGNPVTFLHLESQVQVTVATDPEGSFHTWLKKPGVYSARAGGRFWRSKVTEFEATDDSKEKLEFIVTPAESPLESLSSAQWLSLLPDGGMKREFMVNCTSCHEISWPRIVKDGSFRDRANWSEAIAMMRAIDEYGLTPSDFDDNHYAEWLATHLTSEKSSNLAVPPTVAGAAAKARFTEYPVPKRPSLPHDLTIGPKGRIWITAFFNDEVWALDPDSGEIQMFPVNQQPDTLAQVRALEFDPSGKLNLLLGGTNAVVRLDPKSGDYETFEAAMYGHSLAVDTSRNVWFNDYFGKPEQLGMIDAKTGKLSRHPLPSANLSDQEGLPLPYGLQIDGEDVLWSTSLAANQLVRFDTRTGEAKSYAMPTPNSGPRRHAVGPDGILWIPEWSTGKLAKFDPKTEQFTEYQPGLSTIGPYDVDVNQKTGEVWMSGSLSSSIFRFDPKSEQWTEFRWPTEPAYVRHIAVDEATGDVWSAYSSLPEAEPKIVRLQLTN